MKTPQRFWIFLSLIFFSGLINLESFLFYVHNWQTGSPSLPLFLLKLPLTLLEHSLIAILLTLPASWAAKTLHRSIVYVSILCLSSGYLVLNQVFYKLFFDHYSPSMTEGQVGNIGNIWGSFSAEVDAVTMLNLIALGMLTWLQFRILRGKLSIFWMPRFDRSFQFGAALWVLGAILLGLYVDTHNLNRHPITKVISSWVSPAYHIVDTPLADIDYETPLYGQYVETPKVRQQITDWLKTVSSIQNPNIIFIVLESVGTLQILPSGVFDPKVTPFLASKQADSATFDNIYVNFPSTARSHVPMLTGGHTITWGSVYKELNYAYEGATLIHELDRIGYQNALFSAGDLSYENRFSFYKRLPYDKIYGFNNMSKEEKQANQLSTWGVDEEYAWGKSLDWIDQQSEPFLMHFMTVCTHHPYTWAAHLKAPTEGSNRLEKYTNALAYTDFVIKKIRKDLEERGIAENTFIVVTGDHGQAFGQRHSGNFTHKNHLYEENIRTFLTIIPPKAAPGFVSSRPGAIGDLMPTIMRLVGQTNLKVPAQDLFSDSYSMKISYFHKSADPQKWGLRDGKWKFIGELRGTGRELYDLQADPLEQSNLAPSMPERVSAYENLVSHWYIKTNNKYRAQLTNYIAPGAKGLTAEDIRSYGPKIMGFGVYKDRKFTELKNIAPDTPMVAWTQWVPYTKDTLVYYHWQTPSGKLIKKKFNVKKGWSDTRVKIPVQYPIPKGEWSLTIKENDQVLLQGSFVVQ